MNIFLKFLKWLQLWSFKVSEDYAIDVMLVHKFRDFSDGVTVFVPMINLDLYRSDHNPKLEISLAIMNVYVFQFELYNVNHMST